MFSIIIPSYNRSKEIPALLESLTHQTIYNFEVILVDDCSKEALELKQLYPFPIRIIRNEENKGAAESRNIGARYAKNEWLLFLDDDDRFLDNKCEIFKKHIQERPEINFIYHPAECVMVNEHFTYFTHPHKNTEEITLDNILLANKIGGMPMIGIKKSFFIELGGFTSSLLSLEDYEFILKVISHPDFMPEYINIPLTICTFHTKRNSVSTHSENTESAIAIIKEKYVKTEQQQYNFKINALYMLAHTYIMNLSRKAGVYYLRMFKYSFKFKHIAIALITFISPKLAINMKRFI